ncbi:hypothetical protein TSOC_003288, partial [Tetrabaena socialis]
VKQSVDDLSGDMDGLRRKVVELEDALRALGIVAQPQTGVSTQHMDVTGASPAGGPNRNAIAVSPGMAPDGLAKGFAPPARKQVMDVPEGMADPVLVDGEDYKQLRKALDDLQMAVGAPPPAGDGAKKPKTLKEDTDDIKKFVRAMGKDVGAMGNDMQTLKKHLDDVEGAMNRALANLAAELAMMKAAQAAREERELETPESPAPKRLEANSDNMAETLNAMAALNAAQQQQLARTGDGTRSDDIDALNEAMRQSENQLARLLAFLKQDVMDRFNVHEKTLIRMAKQIDFLQRMVKGEFDDQRESRREIAAEEAADAP